MIGQGSFIFAAPVLPEAALFFLGVGVPPYVPNGGAIMLTIFGLNLLGDGLRDRLDPKLSSEIAEKSGGVAAGRRT